MRTAPKREPLGADDRAALVDKGTRLDGDRRNIFVCQRVGNVASIRSALRYYPALDSLRQVRSSVVLPGNIETRMMDRFTRGDIQKAVDLEPVGRLGNLKEIAEAMLWMASDLGGFITGAATVVDSVW